MNQGPEISDFAIFCMVVLSVVGTMALLVGALACVDALLTHLRWLP